jgi:hypothetical protein
MALRERVAEEFRAYVRLALYLFICFAAVLSFKAALLAEEGVRFAPFGFAALKAMVFAKFIMLGEVTHVGVRLAHRPLVPATLYRTVALLGVLVALILAEEVIAGLIHGRAVGETLRELAGGRAWEIAATCVLLGLILLPYVALQHIRARLGPEAWQRLLASI